MFFDEMEPKREPARIGGPRDDKMGRSGRQLQAPQAIGQSERKIAELRRRVKTAQDRRKRMAISPFRSCSAASWGRGVLSPSSTAAPEDAADTERSSKAFSEEYEKHMAENP